MPEKVTERRDFYVSDHHRIDEHVCCTHGYRLLTKEGYDEYRIHCHQSQLDGYMGGCVSPTMSLPDGVIDKDKRYCYVVTLADDNETEVRLPVIPTSVERKEWLQ